MDSSAERSEVDHTERGSISMEGGAVHWKRVSSVIEFIRQREGVSLSK